MGYKELKGRDGIEGGRIGQGMQGIGSAGPEMAMSGGVD